MTKTFKNHWVWVWQNDKEPNQNPNSNQNPDAVTLLKLGQIPLHPVMATVGKSCAVTSLVVTRNLLSLSKRKIFIVVEKSFCRCWKRFFAVVKKTSWRHQQIFGGRQQFFVAVKRYIVCKTSYVWIVGIGWRRTSYMRLHIHVLAHVCVTSYVTFYFIQVKRCF